MRNISAGARMALRVSFLLNRHRDVGRAIAPWSPVGYCAGVRAAGERPAFFHGGEAIRGVSGQGANPSISCHKGISPEIPSAVTERTIFRVASVSKIFGAAAALRLVQQKKLDLDSDIRETLGIPIPKVITLRQLLTHTAAISDARYDGAIESGALPPLSALLDESLLPYEPGTRFRYSNFGAGIAGMLVEKASGMLFDDYVRQQFFAPRGIDASFHPQRILRREFLANCYRVPGGTLSYDAQALALLPLDEIPDPEMHYSVPAGRLLIAAPDLLSLMLALPEEAPELFVLQNSIGSVRFDANRGLGVALAPKGVFSMSRTFFGHQGTAYGAVSQAWIDLSDRLCAVLLTNGARLTSGGPLQRVGQRGVAALVRGK